ncbi:hypothetical protein LB531_03000 [Mesorhizobium sp. CO1-1-2]|uniref:hypothetical protein n=1 Tax=Mesorhizobium sp. CO1-1-2 TaxID=2876635 RepID=UPI001CC9ED27|nr:hypothetical protein [Mesorhizobium sp. CO1-1-2]MBZ9679621.1 hypothetical protein [Mesorhizobium sp. CO1-1-2]
MLEMGEETAKRIINAVAVAIDGKPSSAKTFASSPYQDLSSYGDWDQDNNNSKFDTTRTRALLISYLLFSGGRIPLLGIQIGERWFRPDKWVAGALVKRGFFDIDEASSEFVVTPAGWEYVAETLETHFTG